MTAPPDAHDRIWMLSTCGTSILANGPEKDLRAWLNQHANDPTLGDDDQRALADIVATRRRTLRAADRNALRRISAEVNGGDGVRARWRPKRVHHLLLHTDTALGRASAELVREVLCVSGESAQELTTGGLRTDSVASFRAAVSDLAGELIRDHLAQARADGWFIVFNLTGGFKSLNAWLQGIGTLYADRCVFIFDGAPELIELPRLPVDRSNIAMGEVRAHATVFRRLAAGYRVQLDDAKDIAESLLHVDGGEVVTSLWGDVAWAESRAAVYSDGLLPPLSPRVALSPRLHRDFDGIDARHRVQVNAALDAFSAFLDHGRSLGEANSFKKLSGDPVPGSTHELYAWSDGSAGRLFGHFNDRGIFVFDRLDRHL